MVHENTGKNINHVIIMTFLFLIFFISLDIFKEQNYMLEDNYSSKTEYEINSKNYLGTIICFKVKNSTSLMSKKEKYDLSNNNCIESLFDILRNHNIYKAEILINTKFTNDVKLEVELNKDQTFQSMLNDCSSTYIFAIGLSVLYVVKMIFDIIFYNMKNKKINGHSYITTTLIFTVYIIISLINFTNSDLYINTEKEMFVIVFLSGLQIIVFGIHQYDFIISLVKTQEKDEEKVVDGNFPFLFK